jgi:hypothetical protein
MKWMLDIKKVLGSIICAVTILICAAFTSCNNGAGTDGDSVDAEGTDQLNAETVADDGELNIKLLINSQRDTIHKPFQTITIVGDSLHSKYGRRSAMYNYSIRLKESDVAKLKALVKEYDLKNPEISTEYPLDTNEFILYINGHLASFGFSSSIVIFLEEICLMELHGA